MGLIGLVLNFARIVRGGAQVSEATVDRSAGANLTADHYTAPGVDAAPLPADYVLMVPTGAAGRYAAAGYADTLNAPKAGPGEMRIYARAAGVAVAEVWLKSDGSIVVANLVGSVTLQVDGSVEHWTGTKITALGDVKTALGVSLNTHTHGGVTTGPGTSGPPIPAP